MIAGRYSPEREIGRGGSGPVWLGRDEVLGRQVALKRIGFLPGADQPDLARAEREARLSARLNHPHVVSVFDVVVDDETRAHWLVMEYVDGLDLNRLVRERGALTPDAAAPLLRQAADALAAAHGAGIAHRDVKPSNILIDHHGQVKLTDFGIARISTDATLTQTGMVTGSPAYLSPEVATGARGDEASDVWALGATAFYLLSGRPPYEIGDNVLGALYRIVNEEPPRLPEAGWLTPLLEGTMVKEPAGRWTMEQVRDFLDSRGSAAPAAAADEDRTRTLPVAGVSTGLDHRGLDHRGLDPRGLDHWGLGAPEDSPGPEPGPSTTRPNRRKLLAGLLVAAAVLAVVGALLYGASRDAGDEGAPAAGKASGQGSTSPSAGKTSRSPSPSRSPTPTPSTAGIERFIRDYVDTVAKDPAAAWQMLTPKFQRESGGFEQYRSFWDPATNGRVLSVSADPENLTVSYQVHFDNWDNGPGPTVLDLAFDKGRYRIDGERSAGFQPQD